MSADVQALVPLLEYQQSRAHLFPSLESLRWFIKTRKRQLVDAGALLDITRRHMILPARFDAVVMESGQQRAARKAA